MISKASPKQTAANLAQSFVSGNAARLHHIGFVVPRIAGAVPGFTSSLQMYWDGAVFHDPVQTVRVTFLRHSSQDTPLIELVEPACPQSRVSGFLKKGGGLHHLCYEVDSVSVEVEAAVSAGAILVLEPSPAVAFHGREIAWVCTPDLLLIEYLQRPSGGASTCTKVLD